LRIRRLSLVAFLAAALCASASAQVATKKFPWRPVGGVQDIEVATENVIVGQVVFDLGSTMKGTPIRKSSAKVRVRIDNNSGTDEEVGVAVVVFDAEGNVVAAGSNGTKWGYLNKGDRTYYAIDFPYVYRRLDEAANFIVTLETRAKGKGSKPTNTAPDVEPTPIP
jgi:opacity protein-like surface antigen